MSTTDSSSPGTTATRGRSTRRASGSMTAEAKSLGVKSSLTVDLLLRRRRKAGMIPRWRCG
jgi:hypothetical protein